MLSVLLKDWLDRKTEETEERKILTLNVFPQYLARRAIDLNGHSFGDKEKPVNDGLEYLTLKSNDAMLYQPDLKYPNRPKKIVKHEP